MEKSEVLSNADYNKKILEVTEKAGKELSYEEALKEIKKLTLLKDRREKKLQKKII